jgi:outer membrane protein OmpA-like peptidoglycan-associated protein
MRSFSYLSSVCLLLVSVWVNGLCQNKAQQMGIGLDLAGIRLTGGEHGDSNFNGWFGLRLSYFPSDRFGISYLGHYGYVSPKKHSSILPQYAAFELKTFSLAQSVDFLYYIYPGKRFKPFISGGPGLIIWDLRNTKNSGPPLKDGLFYGTSLNDGVSYNATLSGSVGSEYALSENVVVTGYLRLTYLFDQKIDNIGSNDINDKVAQIGLNLSYRFGGMKDSDGDGIYDKYDKEPLLPEDMDGFEDDDGAPDLDNDGDGIPDTVDKAPLLAEDIDGFQDDDGVPDPDNDWDGIPDALDGAPNEPEDLDGYQDDDGIPDPDNDNDGVPDVSDKCKDVPETINGYRDDDGCPDEVPPPIVEKGERIVLQGVNFELNSAELTPESYSILDNVFESLSYDPEIQVEIRGYTDNTGGLEYNMKLSQSRAETVRRYLIEKGIDSYRLKANGYGPENPIADNSLPEGRAKNRRIEFYREK